MSPEALAWRLAPRAVGAMARGLATGAIFGCAALMATSPLSGQSLHGLVLDSENGNPIPRALIRLVDQDEKDRAVTVADSLGRYALSTPGPGDYRIVATGYGYRSFASPLLGVGLDRAYAVDIELDRAPVPIPGLVVTSQRFAELERGIHLIVGLNPKSLRYEPIFRPEIESHLVKGHNVTDLVRWSNLSSVVTSETTDGPCFQWRSRHCMPVFLNGAPLSPEFVSLLPLDMIEAVVVLGPGESLHYNSGAVLLYTAGWIP